MVVQRLTWGSVFQTHAIPWVWMLLLLCNSLTPVVHMSSIYLIPVEIWHSRYIRRFQAVGFLIPKNTTRSSLSFRLFLSPFVLCDVCKLRISAPSTKRNYPLYSHVKEIPTNWLNNLEKSPFVCMHAYFPQITTPFWIPRDSFPYIENHFKKNP